MLTNANECYAIGAKDCFVIEKHALDYAEHGHQHLNSNEEAIRSSRTT